MILASKNRDKIRELRMMLEGTDMEVRSMLDFPAIEEVKEDGDTFAENALKKARSIFEKTGKISLADDTGLVVPALSGAPGVYSARYAGEKAVYEDNVRKLLKEMSGIQNRKAKFVCTMALLFPGGEEHIVSGSVEGLITESPRGRGGFGYDPVFLVPEYKKTFAEMDTELKNRISHRAKALEEVLKILKSYRRK
ncbi:MAG TPA: XTP/dITP diphosphatase [bacterium]|nr:XTP/dITP diphosphatase [bacterium]